MQALLPHLMGFNLGFPLPLVNIHFQQNLPYSFGKVSEEKKSGIAGRIKPRYGHAPCVAGNLKHFCVQVRNGDDWMRLNGFPTMNAPMPSKTVEI